MSLALLARARQSVWVWYRRFVDNPSLHNYDELHTALDTFMRLYADTAHNANDPSIVPFTLADWISYAELPPTPPNHKPVS